LTTSPLPTRAASRASGDDRVSKRRQALSRSATAPRVGCPFGRSSSVSGRPCQAGHGAPAARPKRHSRKRRPHCPGQVEALEGFDGMILLSLSPEAAASATSSRRVLQIARSSSLRAGSGLAYRWQSRFMPRYARRTSHTDAGQRDPVFGRGGAGDPVSSPHAALRREQSHRDNRPATPSVRLDRSDLAARLAGSL